MDNTAPIEFEDLAPVEVPVRIGKKRYVLREALSDAVIKYRNALTKGAKADTNGGGYTLGEMASAEPIAVASCLFEVYDPNKDPRPVLLSELNKWRSSIVTALFDRLKQISPDLEIATKGNKGTENRAKNGQSAGTDNSA